MSHPKRDDDPLIDRIDAAAELLEEIAENRGALAGVGSERIKRLLMAAGRVANPSQRDRRRLARANRRKKRDDTRAADEALLAQTGIRRERAKQVFETPLFGRPPAAPGADIDEVLDPARPRPGGPARPGVAERPKLIEPRTCYVCKTDFDRLHHFYDSLCPPCAELNFTRRSATADLRGRVAVITGARVKIGYQAAIMMLRAGCRVIVTTRFPRDAARRYASEVDAADWADRLEIHGVDLRYTPAVELFCRHLLDASERLDFIINNACQTVRKPVGFYAHLMACERRAHAELPAPERALLDRFESSRAQLVRAGDSRGLVDSAELSQRALIAEDRIDSPGLFPPGELDADLQQVDLRERNSWRLGLDEVSAAELIEVHLVNAVAPFVLNGRLRPLMARVPTHDKHIVNVSAMEGQFYRSFKTDKHPHTNMAKAALNMMTRTSAADYIADGIHMNSVDTGWITDEDPVEIARRKTAEHRFHPPLDIVDGAARIVDPIFGGFSTGRHRWGLFLKDYAPTDW